MNDFTKEELEAMKYWCREDHIIVTKLQLMIDNYCEHDEGLTQGSMMVFICNKCGVCE